MTLKYPAGCLLFFAVSLCVFPAMTIAAQPACTVSAVEEDPEGVIQPCTAIIDNPASSKDKRGYALYVRGKGYHNTKRFDRAGKDYDEAIELALKNDELFVSRANIALRRGDSQEGLEYLDKALALNPSCAPALRTLGALMQGDPEQANRYLTMALAADPKEPYALLFRSRNFLALGKFDLALKDAEALVTIPPMKINRLGYLDEKGDRLDFHVIALRQQAEIYDNIGQVLKAEQTFGAAVDYKRSSESLGNRGIFLAYKNGREIDALADLNEAISLETKNESVYFAKGLVHIRLDQYQDALSAFDGELKVNPRSAYALKMRARVYRQLGETEAAVEDMTRAIALSGRTLREEMETLRIAGYWTSKDTPEELTPALQDAIRACMIDEQCN
jgi:tetratricopeptide (TPR) repeat protein